MSEHRKRYVITYDVENDALRNLLSKALRRVGFRVQKSVFECLLDGKDFERLDRRLTRLVEGRAGVDVLL